MYGYILCNNKQELNLSATGAVCEMHENNFLRSLTDLGLSICKSIVKSAGMES
mgnify:CR=1 FL=1